jgi:hypothetical protein
MPACPDRNVSVTPKHSRDSLTLNSPGPQSSAPESLQRAYDHAIRDFIDWYCSEPRLAFNKTVVIRSRINLEQAHYAASTINLRLAVVRRLAYEASDAGLLSPELAAGIRRVRGPKKPMYAGNSALCGGTRLWACPKVRPNAPCRGQQSQDAAEQSADCHVGFPSKRWPA